MRHAIALLVPALCWMPFDAARAEPFAFTAVLEIQASVGTSALSFPLLSVETAGVADITSGVVHIAAGEISAAVPTASGFGGTLVNGSATFSAGGAGAGATCPLVMEQEVCIQGGGFGGAMRLAGISQLGQAFSVWGVGGSHVGATTSGLTRAEQATRWTAGEGTAAFYVTEIDPGTPFAISDVGTFRGLPSTYGGPGPAGFSVVTPVVVTADLAGSSKDVRALAKLRVDFKPSKPLPIGGAGALAILLVLAGIGRLRRRSRVS